MTDLHEVVELGATANDGVTHGSTIDGGVGTDLVVAFEDDVADLRDLLILTVDWGEAEAVGTDDASGMEYRVVADDAIVIDLDASIEDAVATDLDVLAQVDLWIDL